MLRVNKKGIVCFNVHSTLTKPGVVLQFGEHFELYVVSIAKVISIAEHNLVQNLDCASKIYCTIL